MNSDGEWPQADRTSAAMRAVAEPRAPFTTDDDIAALDNQSIGPSVRARTFAHDDIGSGVD